jgi:hypothetical protein
VCVEGFFVVELTTNNFRFDLWGSGDCESLCEFWSFKIANVPKKSSICLILKSVPVFSKIVFETSLSFLKNDPVYCQGHLQALF